MKIPYKHCANCRHKFFKQENCSLKNWKGKSRYCSVACASKTYFKKGKPSWNKGLKGYNAGEKNNMWKGGAIWKPCLICGNKFNLRELSINQRDKIKCCSRKCSNIFRQSNEFRDKQSQIIRSKNLPEVVATKKLRSLLRRNSIYNRWRERVFKRDNFTCQICGKRGGKIIADHIEPFIKIMIENKITTYEEAVKCKKLWDIKNGRTLCLNCHYKTDTFGSKVHSTIAKLIKKK